MTQKNITPEQARHMLTEYIDERTTKELSELVKSITKEDNPKKKGETNKQYAKRIILGYEDSIVVQMALMSTVPSAPQGTPEPTTTPDPEPVPEPKPLSPWMVAVIHKMVACDKAHFISLALIQRTKENDTVVKEEINKVVKRVMEDDVIWDNRIKPRVLEIRKWVDDSPGAIATGLYKAGNATHNGMSKATEWTGKKIEAAGKALVNSADKVGRVAAAPMRGAGNLVARKPEIQK